MKEATPSPIVSGGILEENSNNPACRPFSSGEKALGAINYLDLFSGIGGFAEGFRRAGWKFDKHYYSEIDKYAKQIYQRHFPTAIPVGDVSKVDGTKLGKINLITFGFPCQDLSIAGKRKGLEGARSGLFYQATRLIRECRPDIFIFENVKGLLTSDGGRDFERVLREIADIGLYDCEWQLVNTSWVLPQNRERIYFIGHLAGGSSRKIFPFTESCEEVNDIQRKAREERNGISCGVHQTESSEASVEMRRGGRKRLNQVGHLDTKYESSSRVYSTDGIGAQLTAQGGGWGAKTGLYEIKD